MTPLELERALATIYGEHWRTKAPEALGIGRTTLYRYVTCETEIPRLLEVAVAAQLELHHIKMLRRATQSRWRRKKRTGAK